jgi:hypothetical protein
MSRERVFIALAIAAGLASGSWALENAAASGPLLDWGTLAFLSIGTALAAPIVLGFQVAAGNNNGLRTGWRYFALAFTYILASGVSALIFSVAKSSVGPHSFLIVVLGIAGLLGLAITKTLYAKRLSDEA